MKKIFALVLAILMVASLAACGTATDTATADETAKVYTIVSDNAFAPFESYDNESGEYVGIDMDIMKAIAEDQGFEYNMMNVGFDPALAKVQAGQADAVIAGMTINDERKEIFDFSEGYFEDGQVMVVAKDSDIDSLDDLKGKVVATKNGTMGAEYANENKDQYGYTTKAFEGSNEQYQAIINGNCVACFEDYTVIVDAIKNGVELKTVGDKINPSYYGFAVKKGTNAELITKFNAGLANIKENGKYDEILAKYGM
ncbi:MAG: transporter substrate-binding domain-containing protein [Ruminococcus sp.]|nr:transporter substrate-binding domain-containing protein [Ruminococcus sp.]